MNLSKIVHTGHQNPRIGEARLKHQYQNPYIRRPNDQRQDMATALIASPGIKQSPVYTRPPQPPPSPPAEDPISLRTLPSIQSLIKMDTPQSSYDHQDTDIHKARRQSPVEEGQPTGYRPQPYGQPTVSHPDSIPPSPPIDPQLGFDDPLQSPSATSTRSSTTGRQYALGGHLANHQHRQPPPTSSHIGMIPSQSSQSPYQNASYVESQHPDAPFLYPSPAAPGPHPIYYQRPLPTGFPPATPPGNVDVTTPVKSETPSTDPTQWQTQHQHQHHHYIAHSSATQFPVQNLDRYVCQICHKAFSRPSSLKIHSHSHTGEKPFLCPHKGCGKAFSVRSNMKRHERGCHGGGGDTAA